MDWTKGLNKIYKKGSIGEFAEFTVRHFTPNEYEKIYMVKRGRRYKIQVFDDDTFAWFIP